jgi:hypothetical protein
LPQIVESVRLLYEDFSVEIAGFADFHIKLAKPRNLHYCYRPQVACFLNGENPFAPLPLNQAFAMFESCLNWAIYTGMYNYLIIHAAAVERNGYAAILPAPPGSGKSTLCAALVSRGWRLLTDELTLLCPQTESVLPLARPISLKNESIKAMQRFAPTATFGPEIHNTIKGTIAYMRAPSESVRRMDDSAIPGWMIFPNYEPGGETSVRSLSKAQTFRQLAGGLVNHAALGVLGFRLFTNLIDRTDCYEFAYSDLEEATVWFDQLKLPDRRESEIISIYPSTTSDQAR